MNGVATAAYPALLEEHDREQPPRVLVPGAYRPLANILSLDSHPNRDTGP